MSVFVIQGGLESESDFLAIQILDDAKSFTEAGAFSYVLEAMKSELAKKITKDFETISLGIGAGKNCDGQILVIDDLLGLYSNFTPKFVKKYVNLNTVIEKAVKKYSKEVKTKLFPKNKNFLYGK